MSQTEFYLKLNDFLQKNGILRCNGYERFIRLSYRKYVNPQMRWTKDGTNYKPLYKLLAKIRQKGVFNEYEDLIKGKLYD